jgi:hypothetical protein
MLWKFCAEKFFFDAGRAIMPKKTPHAQPPEFFNGISLPLASAALYIRSRGR